MKTVNEFNINNEEGKCSSNNIDGGNQIEVQNNTHQSMLKDKVSLCIPCGKEQILDTRKILIRDFLLENCWSMDNLVICMLELTNLMEIVFLLRDFRKLRYSILTIRKSFVPLVPLGLVYLDRSV
jgi:hypothetical protein